MKITKNDKVMVFFSDGTQLSENPARKLHGQTFTVKKRRDVMAMRGARGSYYELVGAVSPYGIPYAFTADQLIRI